MRREEHRIERGAGEGSLVTIEVQAEWCEHPRGLMGVELFAPDPVVFAEKSGGWWASREAGHEVSVCSQ